MYNFFTSLLYLEVHFVQPIKHNICFYKTNMINKDGKKRERERNWPMRVGRPAPLNTRTCLVLISIFLSSHSALFRGRASSAIGLSVADLPCCHF